MRDAQVYHACPVGDVRGLCLAVGRIAQQRCAGHGCRLVGVSGRGGLSAPPQAVDVGGARVAITAWAGPWPVDERWWDATEGRRRARIQAVTADGVARLYALEAGGWGIEATYD